MITLSCFTDESTNQSKSGSSDSTADLVAAAAIWRRRFMHQTKDGDLDSNQTDTAERPVLTEAHILSEAFVEHSAVSVERRAIAGRAARGRRNPAGRRRSRSSADANSRHEAGEQETQTHQSESHETKQDKNPAGEQNFNQSEGGDPKEKTPRRGGRRGQNGGRTKTEEEPEGRRGLEKTCEDAVESPESEKNDEDLRLTSGHEVDEKNDKESNPSSAPLENLEPWQQLDFCIEDILKPVARSKSRGSVRRSLRHRRSVDVLDKGLAWVEHTSPQMITSSQRRRTRGRLSAVSQPPPLSDPDGAPTQL